MRNLVYGVASAASVALASPALAADLPVTRYGEPGVTYQREVHKYEYRQEAPRVVVRRPIVTAPIVTETVVVRRPIVVIEQPVVVEDYPVYAAPVYAAPRVYAYGGYPVWRGGGWGYRRHFHGSW
jgi:hypothetical protein